MVPVDVTSVRVISGFLVELSFDDGTTRRVDLEPYLKGPVFEPVRRDPAFFSAVAVDPDTGTIAWPNGADIDPLVLRWGLPVAAG